MPASSVSTSQPVYFNHSQRGHIKMIFKAKRDALLNQSGQLNMRNNLSHLKYDIYSATADMLGTAASVVNVNRHLT